MAADRARTRGFARVIGPSMVIVAVTVAVRAPGQGMADILESFFDDPALVWITGALLVVAGVALIALHQDWSSVAAALISALGWLMTIRGVLLLVAPRWVARAADAAMGAMPLVQLGFGLVALAGLWLSYVGWIAAPSGVG